MRHFYLLFAVIISNSLFAQPDLEKQKIIERRIEFIGENLEDSDLDLTVFLDDFYAFLENPINLNNTTFEELSRLHLLSEIQIISLLNYVKKYGDMITVYELSAIPELDAVTVQMILPFVKAEQVIKDNFKWKYAFKYGKHEVLTRYTRVLETKAGYLPQTDSTLTANPNKQYLGSPDQFYLRYRGQYKDRLSYGITAEKDAGEEFFRGTQKQGFDYYSAHIFINKLWKFKSIALGDYQVNFGQGLTMWSGFAMGKTPNVFGGKRYAQGLRRYTSVNESLFLRGGGFSFGNETFDFTYFASYKSVDANVNQADTLEGIFDDSFSSFQITGYHRLPSEIEDKNKVKEFITGGELAYHGENLRIGLAAVYTSYDLPLNGTLKPYNQYKFNSGNLVTAGINYRYFYRKISLFGEVAMSDNVKMGSVNGLTWHADPTVDLMIIHRYYDKAFHSIYSAGFGESSDNTGENGLYFGALLRVSKKVSISSYYDQFNYTYLKYLTDDYSSGRDFFVQTDFALSRNTKIYVRFRNKITERNSRTEGVGIHDQITINKTSLRLNYDQRINSYISVQSRVEWVTYLFDQEKSNGLLLFQDIEFKFKKIPLKIYSRYAIFDTDNYDARVYAYENDLLYVFSIPSYYYKGIRSYLMLKYEISNKIDLWLRWGVWSYHNRTEISSGLEEISGPKKTDIKIQLKINI